MLRVIACVNNNILEEVVCLYQLTVRALWVFTQDYRKLRFEFEN